MIVIENQTLGNILFKKSNLQVNSGEVIIWQIDYSQDLFEKILPSAHVLSLEEKARTHHFSLLEDKSKFIFSHVVLRLILSNYTGLSPEGIDLYENQYGKPYIRSGEFYFNISHAKEKLAIAISKTEIGIDLEYIDAELNLMEIEGTVLTKSEISLLSSFAPKLQAKQFFLFWTRKEAIVKAIGIGLSLDLREIDLCDPKVMLNGFRGWKTKQFTILDQNFIGHVAWHCISSTTLIVD
jgi:4'-phosphopantetheinyl transferase